MVVKVLVKNQFVDVPIKEGELFLLPGRIPHSPQRFSHTIGLVIEREREEGETDCLRWYVPEKDEAEVLYEEYFHCFDLGQQLKPVIQRFFASEEKKTGIPTNKLNTSHPVMESSSSLQNDQNPSRYGANDPMIAFFLFFFVIHDSFLVSRMIAFLFSYDGLLFSLFMIFVARDSILFFRYPSFFFLIHDGLLFRVFSSSSSSSSLTTNYS